MATAPAPRVSRKQREEIQAWVERELTKPEARKPLTPEQNRVIGTVLANHIATKAAAG